MSGLGRSAQSVQGDLGGSQTPKDAQRGAYGAPPQGSRGASPNPCGHWTKHTGRIGCCATCGELFAGDDAFTRHRGGSAKCRPPESLGLVAKPSPTCPGERIWHRDKPVPDAWRN